MVGVPPKIMCGLLRSKQEAAVLKAVEEVHGTVEDAPVVVKRGRSSLDVIITAV